MLIGARSRLPGHLTPASCQFRISDCGMRIVLIHSAIPNPHSAFKIARPGIEPGLRPSRGRVQSNTLTGCKYRVRESNPVLHIRSLPCSSVTLARYVIWPGPGLSARRYLGAVTEDVDNISHCEVRCYRSSVTGSISVQNDWVSTKGVMIPYALKHTIGWFSGLKECEREITIVLSSQLVCLAR